MLLCRASLEHHHRLKYFFNFHVYAQMYLNGFCAGAQWIKCFQFKRIQGNPIKGKRLVDLKKFDDNVKEFGKPKYYHNFNYFVSVSLYVPLFNSIIISLKMIFFLHFTLIFTG